MAIAFLGCKELMMPSQADNARALNQGLNDELAKQLRDIGLGVLVERAVGSGSGVVTFLWSLVKSRVDKMRDLAQVDVRSKYGDQRIHLVGQQIGDFSFTSEQCWAYVHTVGGTLWLQNVYVTADEGLSLVVFWHPDPKFKLDKDVIRIYRGSRQCDIDDGPSVRAAP
ncbi:hypothetical protein [Paraburkholderia dokdonensis]|uniref:hypothetical protein n=1 Tax=Paraburkholderia dokdonensis TaxID=2211211 RepID=UPI001019FB3D|nr:hypothetical protein [Paraburkholderia dokdonensis]